MNANGPRSYSSNDYSNELPEPDDLDDPDDEDYVDEPAPPPPPTSAPKPAQLALPPPPKGMKPGPRTAKLAQQLGKQVGNQGLRRGIYIIQADNESVVTFAIAFSPVCCHDKLESSLCGCYCRYWKTVVLCS